MTPLRLQALEILVINLMAAHMSEEQASKMADMARQAADGQDALAASGASLADAHDHDPALYREVADIYDEIAGRHRARATAPLDRVN